MTERLILRRFAFGDAPAYFEMLNQPAVVAAHVPGPPTLEQAGLEISMIEGHWDLVGFSLMAVVERSTGLLVGRVGPWMPFGWPALEVGWAIHPRRWRRGYAAEAASASVRWIFERQPDLEYVIHMITKTNTGSLAVAEKLGAVNSGEVFHHPSSDPLDIWGTTRDAFSG